MSCQIYLIAPDHPSDNFLYVLSKALDTIEIPCVLWPQKPQETTQDISRICATVQERGVAFLLQDAPDYVADCGADGVHLTNPDHFTAARALLGRERIIGVDCGASRHAALLSSDGDKTHAGADYVAFNPQAPRPIFSDPALATFEQDAPQGNTLLRWWQDMMTVPCVAIGSHSLAEAQTQHDADFVAVQPWSWSHADDPLAALTALSVAFNQVT